VSLHREKAGESVASKVLTPPAGADASDDEFVSAKGKGKAKGGFAGFSAMALGSEDANGGGEEEEAEEDFGGLMVRATWSS
jgi:hypothetical protein